jgi:hypothetical protein
MANNMKIEPRKLHIPFDNENVDSDDIEANQKLAGRTFVFNFNVQVEATIAEVNSIDEGSVNIFWLTIEPNTQLVILDEDHNWLGDMYSADSEFMFNASPFEISTEEIIWVPKKDR